MTSALVKSLRPRQWSKNLFVFAGLLFTLDQYHPISDFVKVAAAFLLFCILSGCIYLVNDILDVEQDRKHPEKSLRPIASGALSIKAAWTAAVILLISSLAASFVLNQKFGIAAVAYAVLLVLYSFSIKKIVLLDVMTIAAGFVLRAVAGAVVIPVHISPWLLICTSLLALFMALAKRRDEILLLEEEAVNHRPSLEHYSVQFLDQLIIITSATTIIAYALYTFFSPTGFNHPYLIATLPFVIYGVFRYLLLVNSGAGAGAPELLLVRDKPLLADIFLWAIACAIIVTR